MSGAVRIERETFYSKKDLCDLSNSQLTALICRYKELFSKYDCFTVSKPVHQNHKIKSRKPHHLHSQNIIAPKDVNRCLQNLWNTLNDANYTKILQKLKLLINADNIDRVCHDILNTAVKHNTYRKQFLRILIDMSSNWGKDKVMSPVKKWFDEHVLSEFYLFTIATNMKLTDYDVFCMKTKHKQRILSYNNLVMDIHDMLPLADISIHDYLDNIMNGFLKTHHDDYYMDLFLNIIKDFSVQHKEKVFKHKDIIISSCEELSFKNKFLLEKIMNTIT